MWIARRRVLGTLTAGVFATLTGCEVSRSENTTLGKVVLGGYGNDDDPLSEAVRKALRSQAEIARHNITVSNDNGKITLGGFVDNKAERDTAERVADRVDGVTFVVNTLHTR